jgi:hypothetical protein
MKAITIQVENQVSQLFETADETKKQELSYLVSLFLEDEWRDLSLIEVMRKIGRNAKERGLTPEILEELLKDD